MERLEREAIRRNPKEGIYYEKLVAPCLSLLSIAKPRVQPVVQSTNAFLSNFYFFRICEQQTISTIFCSFIRRMERESRKIGSDSSIIHVVHFEKRRKDVKVSAGYAQRAFRIELMEQRHFGEALKTYHWYPFLRASQHDAVGGRGEQAKSPLALIRYGIRFFFFFSNLIKRNKFVVRRPQSRRDDPLNLSILLSGGKETNKDFLSSGERTGMSPALNPHGYCCREMQCSGRSAYPVTSTGSKSILNGAIYPQRVPGPQRPVRVSGGFLLRVGLLENAALSGW